MPRLISFTLLAALLAALAIGAAVADQHGPSGP